MGELTRTVSGNLASFRTAARVPIENLKVHFTPSQQGTGDPSPTNVRNIVAPTGVTAYRDIKKVVWNQWLKPLTADNWQAYSTHNSVSFSNQIATSEWLDSNTGYSASIRNKVGTLQSAGQVWYVSYMVKPSVGGLNWGVEFCGGRQNTCIQSAEANVWQQCSSVDTYRTGTRNYTYISYCRAIASEDRIGMIAQNKSPILINLTQMFGAGNEPTKEEFETQCLLNGIDLTQYHEYNEGTERGWITSTTQSIPVTFPTVGKNLFNSLRKLENSVVSDTGNIKGASTYCTYSISVPKNTNLIISKNKNIGSTIGLSNKEAELNDEISYLVTMTNRKTYSFNTEEYNWVVFSIGKNQNIQEIELQLELGSTATSYEPYYPETVYGGYVDLITGEVWKEYEIIEKPWKNWILHGTQTNTTRKYVEFINRIIEAGVSGYKSLSNVTPYAWKWTELDAPHHYISTAYGAERVYTWLPINFDEEQKVQVVGKLVTPIKVATFTQQELKTFLGVNNIWADSGSVDVTYALHDSAQMMEARKKIMLNSPHIATASGSIANFSTDIASPLKSCKLSFLPVQEGSGDPSPENVRAITGWTGLNGWKTGKNMAHVFGYSAMGIVKTTSTRILTNTYGTTINTISPESTTLVITQSQAPESSNLAHYRNGYFSIGVDSLIFDNYYDVSFKITNITDNPLNASLSNLNISNPYGNRATNPTIINNNIVIFRNVRFRQDINNLDRRTIDVYNCGMSFTLSEFMVTPANQSDGVFETYQGTTIPVDWSSSGTIYGGWVDLVTGEVWKTHHSFVIDGVNYYPASSVGKQTTGMWTGYWRAYDYIGQSSFNFNELPTGRMFPQGGSEFKINKFKNETPISGIGGISCVDVGKPYIRLYFDESILADVSDNTAVLASMRSYLEQNPIQVSYRIAEPQLVTTLTPQQLKTLKGTNNIWSNANGDVDVKYWTH